MTDIREYVRKSPGEYIMEFLNELGWTQKTLSEITGIPLRAINKMANDVQAISVEYAVLLANAFSTDAAFWVRISAEYQIEKERKSRAAKEELASLKAQLHKYMPVADLVKKGWISKNPSSVEGIKEVYRSMFGSDELQEDYYEAEQGFCARRNRDDERFTRYYCKTWELFARRYASEMQDLLEYRKQELELFAEHLNDYTVLPDGVAAAIEELNQMGVGFFVLPHLQKTYLDGAAFIEGKNPFIVYTGRYDREDNFWFVIAHEIAHILLHLQTGATFFDDMDGKSEMSIEAQADRAAGEYLKKERVLALSKAGSYLTKARLHRISEEANVATCVALGVLQHEGKIPWRQYADEKPKVLDKIPQKYFRGMM